MASKKQTSTKRPDNPRVSRKKAVATADKWFSRYIRKRDTERSVTSGRTENLTCSHLISRRFYATRWDEENAFCQTSGENLYHNRDPGPLTAYYLTLHDPEDYQQLYRKARSGKKFSTKEIAEIGEYYKEKYHRLEEGNEFFSVFPCFPGREGWQI